MQTVALTGLVKIELPGGTTVRLCDGGVIKWAAETFAATDATFGAIGGVDSLAEGVGDEVPALELSLFPPDDADPDDLSQPGFQTARVRFWLAEYDPATGEVTSAGDPMFDGQIDTTELHESEGEWTLAITVVALIERLFERNIGNSLSPMFHKSVWPGETGHDNATGLGRPVAWGTFMPASNGTVYTASPFGAVGDKRAMYAVDRVV